ncbi:ImmA/IrrE family metallo-endopeptidase [Nocardia sp. CDC159]|uniref:ImmA/IrrE family metallo-endopeptidase n=1 Tax=Nocardia pulmonis TaxID=2951408 RepID=A0A9X2EC88_9NOCA|nr:MULTISPECIES: ImmA/IrrE family metallo-endopeptidase [Nocardia]MCM6778067.1 ImmA/IrrE family metallo-endopeptidase [Nocardia pulmonis]MCM6790956.1 ImmA/IrrE family metallo-endopeptidase [Nocardia sp. CDC159]
MSAAQPPRDIDAHCAELVAALAARSAPAAVGAVVRVVADRTGRPIELRPVSLGGTEVFGLWVALADHDLILYDSTASPAHRNHIVQHELGHIVLGHGPLPSAEYANSRCRSDFHDPVEEEAELFARRLTWRLTRYSATAASSGVARRITDTLTGGESFR